MTSKDGHLMITKHQLGSITLIQNLTGRHDVWGTGPPMDVPCLRLTWQWLAMACEDLRFDGR